MSIVWLGSQPMPEVACIADRPLLHLMFDGVLGPSFVVEALLLNSVSVSHGGIVRSAPEELGVKSGIKIRLTTRAITVIVLIVLASILFFLFLFLASSFVQIII